MPYKNFFDDDSCGCGYCENPYFPPVPPLPPEDGYVPPVAPIPPYDPIREFCIQRPDICMGTGADIDRFCTENPTHFFCTFPGGSP